MVYVSESGVEEILTSVLEERFPEIKSLTEHQKNMAYKTRKTVNRLECKSCGARTTTERINLATHRAREA